VRSRDAPQETPVESNIPTPSTEGLEPNSWLSDDKETAKERDYFYNEVRIVLDLLLTKSVVKTYL
jgi:hypothetical protein